MSNNVIEWNQRERGENILMARSVVSGITDVI
jgi:hypothetical protein